LLQECVVSDPAVAVFELLAQVEFLVANQLFFQALLQHFLVLLGVGKHLVNSDVLQRVLPVQLGLLEDCFLNCVRGFSVANGHSQLGGLCAQHDHFSWELLKQEDFLVIIQLGVLALLLDGLLLQVFARRGRDCLEGLFVRLYG